MNAMTKIRIPTNAKTSAAMMLPSGTRFILFASCVMVRAAVNRAVRAGIIADGLRNVFELVDVVVARRDARDHDSVILFPFGPGPVAVITGVVAHFAAEVPGLSGVAIDERIVQVNPMVADRRVGFHFHG